MKRLFLIFTIVFGFMSCHKHDAGCEYRCLVEGRYFNTTDYDLNLAAYMVENGAIVRTFTYTIPANDSITLIDDSTSDLTIREMLPYADSIYGVWGGERSFAWGRRENYLNIWQKRQVVKIKDYLVRTYFTFTPEMYDAATPINPPTEE